VNTERAILALENDRYDPMGRPKLWKFTLRELRSMLAQESDPVKIGNLQREINKKERYRDGLR